MKLGRITAKVISCPGHLGNATFSVLKLNVEGFRSPYVLTLAMRAIGYNALAEQADPSTVFNVLASAVNDADICVEIAAPRAVSGSADRTTLRQQDDRDGVICTRLNSYGEKLAVGQVRS